ncbi:MAG: hypothetical protein JRE23_17110 [Deltaproteobacteria bacterium]|nr:hypothetical protein [Deltaproteobacteria bacterium]
MKEILHLFKESDIREELGIGTVRDAFSDMLFPGTITLHTRAKYMLFIPWIFLKHERKQTTSDQIKEYSRKDEIWLVKALLRSGESEGVIGARAQDSLKILPSYMYWSGLGIWGIRRFPGSSYEYFRSLDGFYKYRRRFSVKDGGGSISDIHHNWDPDVLPIPPNFPENMNLKLNRDEAVYLHDRIKSGCRGSLLAFLLDSSTLTQVNFVWQHPLSAHFSGEHTRIVQHARNFSDVFHGAALLYNLMLSEKKMREEWMDNVREKLASWASHINAREAEVRKWDIQEFWSIVGQQNPHIHFLTRRFIEKWISIVFSQADPGKIIEDEAARRLIVERERRIKGSRARLKNPRMLELWGGSSGSDPLSFRWQVAQRHLNDILNGKNNI